MAVKLKDDTAKMEKYPHEVVEQYSSFHSLCQILLQNANLSCIQFQENTMLSLEEILWLKNFIENQFFMYL